MKLLCLGCLHGKIPKKLVKRLRKEEFDYVLCTGDLADGDRTRKLIFRYWDLLTGGLNLEDFVDKKKLEMIRKEEIVSMKKSVKFLDALGKKVLLVYGNNDYLRKHVEDKKLSTLDELIKKKDIWLIKRGSLRGEVNIAGVSGFRYTFNEVKKVLSKIKKPVIFMTHVPAYGYFDKVELKISPAYGEHVGEKSVLQGIKRYSPLIHISSHMHEHQGKKKLGKTWTVNSGAAYLGRYAIVEIDKGKVKNIRLAK